MAREIARSGGGRPVIRERRESDLLPLHLPLWSRSVTSGHRATGFAEKGLSTRFGIERGWTSDLASHPRRTPPGSALGRCAYTAGRVFVAGLCRQPGIFPSDGTRARATPSRASRRSGEFRGRRGEGVVLHAPTRMPSTERPAGTDGRPDRARIARCAVMVNVKGGVNCCIRSRRGQL